jgi:hypothetical protein
MPTHRREERYCHWMSATPQPAPFLLYRVKREDDKQFDMAAENDFNLPE